MLSTDATVLLEYSISAVIKEETSKRSLHPTRIRILKRQMMLYNIKPLVDSAVFQRRGIILPTQFWPRQKKPLFCWHFLFFFCICFRNFNNIDFFFFFLTANNAVRDEANPQITIHSCTPGSRVSQEILTQTVQILFTVGRKTDIFSPCDLPFSNRYRRTHLSMKYVFIAISYNSINVLVTEEN